MLNKIVALFKKETKVEENSQVLFLSDQLRELNEELEQKYHNFENADPKYIDIAIAEINLIREKHSVVLKELKGMVS